MFITVLLYDTDKNFHDCLVGNFDWKHITYFNITPYEKFVDIYSEIYSQIFVKNFCVCKTAVSFISFLVFSVFISVILITYFGWDVFSLDSYAYVTTDVTQVLYRLSLTLSRLTFIEASRYVRCLHSISLTNLIM